MKTMNPSVKSSLFSFGIALFTVFAIRSSVAEPFKIPSGSMYPNLYVGDFILVNKFAYGVKVPFTDLGGHKPIILLERNAPERGEVIVFRYPPDPSIHYIKRVVGRPGDKIEVRNKTIFINDVAQMQFPIDDAEKEKILNDIAEPRFGKSHIQISKEQLDSVQHLRMTDVENEEMENFGPVIVPSEHLFVMGDNRDFSGDSRSWGFVPFENISGRAEFVWFSFWLDFENPGNSVFKPGRIGTMLN
jgi:signal peptidase I